MTIDAVIVETYRTKTFRVAPPAWRAFRPGQHVDVRLTAADGYQAQRSYSIASSPERAGALDLTIELVEDGEVSWWFHEIAEPGDTFELRGPIGGPFTWSVEDGGPILLVAGGSGVVPLMSMLRHRHARRDGTRALMLYSSRTPEDIIYRDELSGLSTSSGGLDVLHTLTRSAPEGWAGFTGRVNRRMLEQAIDRVGDVRRAFVCGPTGFVESVASGLVGAGVDAERIRTERFGPSG